MIFDLGTADVEEARQLATKFYRSIYMTIESKVSCFSKIIFEYILIPFSFFPFRINPPPPIILLVNHKMNDPLFIIATLGLDKRISATQYTVYYFFFSFFLSCIVYGMYFINSLILYLLLRNKNCFSSTTLPLA